MKNWIFSLVVIIANFLGAQSVSPITGIPQFMGIPVEGDAVLFINKLKAKGFKVNQFDATVTTMSGIFLGSQVDEIMILHTPKTKQVWKVTVFNPEKTTWPLLKSEYQTLLSKLTSKYGEPSASLFSFLSPYEENDGYEMTAVAVEKTSIMAWWDLKFTNGDPSGSIMLELTKWKQNKISWENNMNAELKVQEQAELDAEEL